MRVTRLTASTEYHADRATVRRGPTLRAAHQHRATHVPNRPHRSGRALVPVDGTPSDGATAQEDNLGQIVSYRSNAPFVAHLIAVRDKDPQTREKRRADPQTSSMSYKATFKSTRRFGCGRILTHSA
ncbi:hypothetical protein [Pseudovibrio sp. SPO723]|uniref:hypothetical protein n=1 Tax=Nesiotobacter zosterae TaxID=392721 RepID=UPI0029C12BEE|nr:hypothetical protein [Pseudovibrio sp. SPO723]MDX5594978.1 hypothetical protein [Pseudovibrio sp. SPO723]